MAHNPNYTPILTKIKIFQINIMKLMITPPHMEINKKEDIREVATNLLRTILGLNKIKLRRMEMRPILTKIKQISVMLLEELDIESREIKVARMKAHPNIPIRKTILISIALVQIIQS